VALRLLHEVVTWHKREEMQQAAAGELPLRVANEKQKEKTEHKNSTLNPHERKMFLTRNTQKKCKIRVQ